MGVNGIGQREERHQSKCVIRDGRGQCETDVVRAYGRDQAWPMGVAGFVQGPRVWPGPVGVVCGHDWAWSGYVGMARRGLWAWLGVARACGHGQAWSRPVGMDTVGIDPHTAIVWG